MRAFLTLVAATLAMLITAIPADAKSKKHHHYRIPVERIHIDAPINVAMTLSARRHYRHHGKQVYADPNWQPHLQPQPELMPVQGREGSYRTSHLRHSRGYYRASIYSGSITIASEDHVIGGRPSGCPHAYCGCGLARYLGLHDPRLNLASNWARLFPHTSASPGAVAVRSHHVMQLVTHAGGNNWVVRDYNGGRGMSYIHTRNVAGYTFVSPNGRYASL